MPLALEQALDAAVASDSASKDALAPALAALAALGLLRGAGSWGRDTILRRLRTERIGAIDREIVEAAMRLDPADLARLGQGPGGAADAVAAGDRIAGFLFGELPATLAEAIIAAALLGLLWSYDWRMGVLGLGLTLWNVVAVWRITRGQARVLEARAASEAALADNVEQALTRIETIKLGGLDIVVAGAWARALDRRAEILGAALRQGEAIGARQTAVALAIQAATIGAGGLLIALEPGFGVGELFACLALVFGINDPARRILDAHADASRAATELLRRYRLRATPSAAADLGSHAGPPAPLRQRLAGAGPADWAALRAATPGAELIDGPADLLPGTLADNVTLCAPFDRDRFADALRAACLEDLPSVRAADEILSPGAAGLSTGQRVRLAVARAVYGGAPALLLAGGLAFLDAATARRLVRRLDRRVATLVVAEGPAAAEALPDAPVVGAGA